jgi:hypothetical protein
VAWPQDFLFSCIQRVADVSHTYIISAIVEWVCTSTSNLKKIDVQNNCNKMAAVSVVVVGDSKCGKTQLMNRFSTGSFIEVRILFILLI